jgi:putative ABC transport system substrate-binding protein
MSLGLRRRELIAGLGGAAAWPLAAWAQQQTIPLIGWLGSRTADSDVSMLVSVRRGLGDVGYAEGRNVAVEYHFADGRYDRIPAMAADLVSRRVAVIATGDTPALLVVKAATSTIPVVFITGSDPVGAGLVASMNRPGGNMTGVSTFTNELSGKRLGLLRDLVAKAATIAALIDPSLPFALRGARDATAALGQKLLILEAGTAEEIDAQFARLNKEPADAMLVITSPLFVTRVEQIAALAACHRIPAIYARREFAEAGGLMSYGSIQAEGYREMGRYIGRILNGEKPADLPIIQATRFELAQSRRKWRCRWRGRQLSCPARRARPEPQCCQ